jgi:hypothetical protein
VVPHLVERALAGTRVPTVAAPGFRGNLVNVHLYAARDAR